MTKLQMIKENPAQFLLQNRLNVPIEYQGSPQNMINYLVQSGQISQDQLNNAMKMANNMGVRP